MWSRSLFIFRDIHDSANTSQTVLVKHENFIFQKDIPQVFGGNSKQLSFINSCDFLELISYIRSSGWWWYFKICFKKFIGFNFYFYQITQNLFNFRSIYHSVLHCTYFWSHSSFLYGVKYGAVYTRRTDTCLENGTHI